MVLLEFLGFLLLAETSVVGFGGVVSGGDKWLGGSDVDNPPAVLDPAALSVVEPGVWPWRIVVFLATGFDAWVLDLTAGQFGSVWPVHAKPGPVVRGPDGCDVVFENDRPVVVTYAEAGAYVLHQVAVGARPIDLGVFDNALEIAAQRLAQEWA